jgi:hypothetical protein
MGPVRRNRLLKKLLSSDAKADLLVLFDQNPTLIEGTDEVARRIARTPREIEEDLKDLLDLGFLSKKNVGGNELIGYDRKRAAEIRELLSSQISKSLESE